MNSFKIKCLIAATYDILGLSNLNLKQLNKKYSNNYIRVLNYHHSPAKDKKKFCRQIEWYAKNYEFCGIKDLQLFLDGAKKFIDKPGLLVTFDDGYLDNYEVAHQFLSSHNIPAVYMISAGLIGKKAIRDAMEAEYISSDQLKKMTEQGATIGCHTYSHHRMDASDTEEVLNHEIVEAKKELERVLEKPVDIFCWCGGEEHTYTKAASDLIRSSGYKLGFMTNSAPILPHCDPFQIDRSNIEAGWPISLVKFQLAGPIDRRLAEKRERVREITK